MPGHRHQVWTEPNARCMHVAMGTVQANIKGKIWALYSSKFTEIFIPKLIRTVKHSNWPLWANLATSGRLISFRLPRATRLWYTEPAQSCFFFFCRFFFLDYANDNIHLLINLLVLIVNIIVFTWQRVFSGTVSLWFVKTLGYTFIMLVPPVSL